MMKKALLIAMCLNVSFVAGALGGVNSASAKTESTCAAAAGEANDGGEGEGTPDTKTNTVADGVATIYVSNAGDLSTFVSGSSFSDDYKKATRVNIIGTGVTLSDGDLAAVEKFEGLKLLDLSQVTVTDYSKIKNVTVSWNIQPISLLVAPLANTTNEDGTITYADQVANVRAIAALTDNNAAKFNSVFAVNTNESGVLDLFAMFNNGTNADLLTTVATEKKPGNLVIINSTGDWNFANTWKSLLTEINKVTGAKCLVLSNLANSTSLDLSGITNSAFKRVILPDNYSKQGWTLASTEFGTGSDVKIVQYLGETSIWSNGSSTTYNNLFTYVKKAGGLKEISDCQYYQTNMSDAYAMIFSGNINADDIAFLNGAKNNRISLHALTHVDEEGNNINLTEQLKNVENPYVEYATLPDGAAEPIDYEFTDIFNNCKNLKGLGMAWTVTTPAVEEGGEATKSTGVAIASKERGAAYEVEQLLINISHPEADQTAADGTENYCRLANADKVVFSGLIYAQDLIPRNANDYYTDADGHLTVTYDSDGALSKGTTGTNTSGVMHANKATTWDFSRVRLYDDSDNYTAEQKAAAQNDLCFTAYGYKPTKVYLPEDESVYRLPSSCFSNYGTITSICIPSNYTELGSCAFMSHNSLLTVYTSYVDENGTKKWILHGKTLTSEPTDTQINEHNTCTLPTNLTRIEHYCFANIDKFTDVYVQNNKAGNVPYCEKDGFDASSLYGFGGYSGGHPIQRNSYMNGSKIFSLLHFPSGLKRSQTMLYTDITRQYTQVDETGATDGNGDLLIWPTQSEWIAAEGQANTGYIWSDWSNYIEIGTSTVQNRSEFKKDGELTDLAKTLGLKNLDKSNTFAPATDETPVTKGNTWMGWHQFVLTAAYDYQNDDPTPNPKWHSYITDDNWWTISLPFNMTSTEIESTFGEGTKLCQLVSVVRNATKNTITLKFGDDLVAKAKENESLEPVLVNRAPYMIKPGKQEKLKNETDEENEYTGPVFTLSNEQTETLGQLNLNGYKDKSIADLLESETSKCAVVVNAVNADGKYVDTNDKEIADDAENPDYYKYIFVAQYTKYYIPTYGYFLGWDNAKNGVNYFYQKAPAKVQNWNAYTCTVGHYTEKDAKWVMPGEGTDVEPGRWEFACVMDNKGQYDPRSLNEDKFPNTDEGSSAKISLFFDADETTSIEGISMDGSIQTIPAGTVYNLGGQVVSTTGAAGLAKGIYIANGKKFVVK